jgi:hypothetical protein
VHGGIETQVHFEAGLTEHILVELDDGLVDLVENGDRVGVVVALYRDVISGVAVSQREPVLLARHDVDIGNLAEVDWSFIAPTDDQLVQLVGVELPFETHRVLPTADVRESTRRVGCARYRRDDVIDLDAQGGRPVRVERDVQFTRLLALQVDLRNARDTGQTGLDMVLDQLLIAGQLARGIAGQHADEQRRSGQSLTPAAGADLRLEGIARPRRRLREVVDDVELRGLDVSAHGKRQVDESRAPTDIRVDVGNAGRVAQDVFLRFDDIGLHFLGISAAPRLSAAAESATPQWR